ncbi:MAG: PorV/PorQ family protein [Candidatus Zixiibacteriota bacterium]|nr:MAG: PorV/PorQ family protein [candidate division Zixibacteria bacterium]
MKTIISFITVIMIAGPALADHTGAGTVGAQFLKIGVGSRYQAMGEASVAVANDVYSMYWNPAGLANIENAAISFTRVNWLLDIDLNYVGMARRFEGVGVVGASVMVLSMDEQEVRTKEQPEGTGERFDAGSYAVGLSFARRLTTRLSFGVAAKVIGEKIYEDRSAGYAFDLGTLLYTGYRSLRLGMSISNMGPELQFTGPEVETTTDVDYVSQYKTTPYDLPMVFRVGVAYDVEVGPKSLLTLTTEMKHPNDNLRQGAVGAEYSFDEQFFLRSGYKLNADEETFSLGGGVVTSLGNDVSLTVDYSWQEFGRLQDTQKFSVGFTF